MVHRNCIVKFSLWKPYGMQKPQFGIQFLPTICEHEKIVCRLYCHYCMQEGYCTETIISNLVSANHFLYQNIIFKFSFYKPFASMRKWLAEIILSIWFKCTILEWQGKVLRNYIFRFSFWKLYYHLWYMWTILVQ